jgi:ribosomal protein L11 methyltransferase
LGDDRPALDVHLSDRFSDPNPLIDALLEDFSPFAIEELNRATRRIHFFSEKDRDDASQAIAQFYASAGVTTEAVAVADEQWAERSQAALRAIRVGDLVVAPPWDIPDDTEGETLVIIRPSMGFGTGHHASTRLCLRGLQTRSVTGQTVLDVGTGSGVLAIAAAKRGATSVLAIDSDRDACQTARDNVALNEVSEKVDVRLSDFRQANDLEPAALVFANLSAGLVCHHVADLLRLVASQGALVVGGVTAPEEPSVRQTLEPFGKITDQYAEDEWRALVLERETSIQ